jgi:hypothetical protein
MYCFGSLHHQYFSFLAVSLTFYSQLVRAIEHLTVAAAEPTYPLKSSAQTSLALALAHSRNIPAAIDACRVALTLDSRNERAAGLWLLLISVLESADYVMEVADSLKSQLPNSLLVHSVIAGLQVQKVHTSSLFQSYFVQAALGFNEQCIISCSHLKHLTQVRHAPPFFAAQTLFHSCVQRKNLQGEAFLWNRDVTADPPEDISEDGISAPHPAGGSNIEEFTLWLHCLAAYFQMGTAQKAKGLEALARAKSCVPANSPLLLLCSARVAELQGHKEDALHLYTSAAACQVASASSHPLMRYHSPELYLGRWCAAHTPK